MTKKYIISAWNNKTNKKEFFYSPKGNKKFTLWDSEEEARRYAAESIPPWIYTSVKVEERT